MQFFKTHDLFTVINLGRDRIKNVKLKLVNSLIKLRIFILESDTKSIEIFDDVFTYL